ncbi:MAG: MerR family transcriptional regulator, partial [Oscillospiraceae bacterium]|nr:MerR family transcriptional regulator [Oscillospiraceae bacterium]
MLTVHEAAEISGISVRTLQYYDKIGLLAPAAVTDAGYRLYDDETLRKLRQIMLFRELEFPLKEIMLIMDDKGFDARKALTQQIELLKLRREHLDELIAYAEDIRKRGVEHIMTKKDFSVFDKS